MRRFILTFILAGTIVMISGAQDYDTGIGLRGGLASGFTIKHFINTRAALEGLITTRWHGYDITGLYEKHDQAFDVDHLKWFYGFGAHVGFYNGDYVEWGSPGSTYNVIGIDGIIGIEYSFTEVPLNVGMDLKPAINLIDYPGLWVDFGLSVRYVF
jgi:hypothetical protein